MGQAETLSYLEKNKGWHRTSEIAKALKQTSNLVSRSLRRLYKQGYIELKIVTNNIKYWGTLPYMWRAK